MKKWIYWLGAVLAVLAIAFWWLLLDARAPASAEDLFDLDAYRTMVSEDAGNLPVEIRIETVGTDTAPGFAADAGDFGREFQLAYTALQIVWPDQAIVIGGAADEATAAEMAQSVEASHFDGDAYQRVLEAMLQAEQVLITHEHLDHVMAIARHPDPAALAPRLRLNALQLDAMPQFAIDGELADEIAGSATTSFDGPERIAPGVVRVPSAGHTPGTQSFYVRLASGEEYFLIGDIVWAMSNIDNLSTRPRLLQYLMFDPNEDRPNVLAQVRALHDMRAANPDIILVPSHDRDHLDALVANGQLRSNFLLRSADLGENDAATTPDS